MYGLSISFDVQEAHHYCSIDTCCSDSEAKKSIVIIDVKSKEKNNRKGEPNGMKRKSTNRY